MTAMTVTIQQSLQRPICAHKRRVINGKKFSWPYLKLGTIPSVALCIEQNAWWSFFINVDSGGDYGPDGIESRQLLTLINALCVL